MKRAFVTIATVCLLPVMVTTQSPPSPRAFEVASVKVNTSGETEGSIGPVPDGYIARNVSLRLLVVRAYELRPFQVVGGPRWIDSDRFDVTARAPEGTAPAQVLSMLRTLLQERFTLAVRSDTREQPVYALVRARPDRFGPNLKPSTLNCPEQCSMSGTFVGGGGSLKGAGQTISVLATHLGTAVDRIVVDRTGLQGRFDFEMIWSSGGFRTGAGGVSDPPAVFTAVQEQLGLRLEPSRGPIEVLVVDSAAPPTPD